jgi:hypothetical protein
MPAPPRKPKLFRDPVHDIIEFDQRDAAGRALLELISTTTFQRLRRIRQLGFAYLVYHGAEHSRFSHSLGVAHVATRMYDTLARVSGRSDPGDRVEVVCAALLHDIGHGPFSHAIERVTGVHHEDYTSQLIEDPDSDVHRALTTIDPALPARLKPYFDPAAPMDPRRRVLRDIVSGQLDADRQDYILRDGLHTGVRIHSYDFERIQVMFEPFVAADGSHRLAVSHRATEAVEGYLIARFHMFKQVYLHKAVRAAEKMLEAAFARASELQRAGVGRQLAPTAPGVKLLSGARLECDEFVDLDDTDVWVMLKSWRRDPDPALSRLARGLLERDLYKTVDLDRDDPVLVARAIDRASELARTHGHDPRYAVLPDRAQDTPYKPYDPRDPNRASPIPIIGRDGRAVPIEDRSEVIHLLGSDSYKIWRICLPGDIRDLL